MARRFGEPDQCARSRCATPARALWTRPLRSRASAGTARLHQRDRPGRRRLAPHVPKALRHQGRGLHRRLPPRQQGHDRVLPHRLLRAADLAGGRPRRPRPPRCASSASAWCSARIGFLEVSTPPGPALEAPARRIAVHRGAWTGRDEDSEAPHAVVSRRSLAGSTSADASGAARRPGALPLLSPAVTYAPVAPSSAPKAAPGPATSPYRGIDRRLAAHSTTRWERPGRELSERGAEALAPASIAAVGGDVCEHDLKPGLPFRARSPAPGDECTCERGRMARSDLGPHPRLVPNGPPVAADRHRQDAGPRSQREGDVQVRLNSEAARQPALSPVAPQRSKAAQGLRPPPTVSKQLRDQRRVHARCDSLVPVGW